METWNGRVANKDVDEDGDEDEDEEEKENKEKVRRQERVLITTFSSGSIGLFIYITRCMLSLHSSRIVVETVDGRLDVCYYRAGPRISP